MKGMELIMSGIVPTGARASPRQTASLLPVFIKVEESSLNRHTHSWCSVTNRFLYVHVQLKAHLHIKTEKYMVDLLTYTGFTTNTFCRAIAD